MPTQEQLIAVDDALVQARFFTDEMAKVIGTARSRVNDAKTTLDWWASKVALVTTVTCGFALIGQLFLFRFSWRILRHLPA
jgi:hydrogenase maturation protease